MVGKESKNRVVQGDLYDITPDPGGRQILFGYSHTNVESDAKMMHPSCRIVLS